MPVFQSAEFQIAPRPLIFLHEHEIDRQFCENFEIKHTSVVRCHILMVDDAYAEFSAKGAEIDGNCSGYVQTQENNEYTYIYIALSSVQFHLFANCVLSPRYSAPRISVLTSPLSDFTIYQRNRIYRIDQPLITLASKNGC